MDYGALLACVLNVPKLVDAAKRMALKTRALNLVDSNWENTLEEYDIHKKHLAKSITYFKPRKCKEDQAEVRSISSPREYYHIIVAGAFYYSPLPNGTVSFVVRQCEPLTTIGKAMQPGDREHLHDGARLFIEECITSMCDDCQEQHAKYKVPMVGREWCIKNTKVFNGRSIKHAFRMLLEQDISRGNSFMGILRIEICNRIKFGDSYKVGGKIKEMILFQESCLFVDDEIDIGSSTPMLPTTETSPSITYMSEETATLENDKQ